MNVELRRIIRAETRKTVDLIGDCLGLCALGALAAALHPILGIVVCSVSIIVLLSWFGDRT